MSTTPWYNELLGVQRAYDKELIMSNNNGHIAEGAEAVSMFQLIAVKSAIKLEMLGMTHSGGSVRKRWAIHLGLKPTTKGDAVIAVIQAKIDEAHAKGVGFRKI